MRGASRTPPIACKEHAGWGFGANYIAQQIVPRGGETIFAAAILISEHKQLAKIGSPEQREEHF
jgi:predicted ATP-grasp superfamily ATP-dependent carboligase